jgi:CRP-like cAMP-binding protein
MAPCSGSAVALFGGLGLDISMLALDQDALERRSLARNELLFRQGDKVRAIYFIEEGRLRLERRTFDGRLLFLGTTPAGEFFVEAALFADAPTVSL